MHSSIITTTTLNCNIIWLSLQTRSFRKINCKSGKTTEEFYSFMFEKGFKHILSLGVLRVVFFFRIQIPWLAAGCTNWSRRNSRDNIDIHTCFSSIVRRYKSHITCNNFISSRNWKSLKWYIYPKSRWGSVGLGIIVIILSIIVLSFPVGTTAFLIILLAIALLIDGIARVIHGIADKTSRSWSRIFRIAAGVIAIVLALVIIASPVIGAALVGILLGIALLIIIGIEIIARGVSGRKISLTRS